MRKMNCRNVRREIEEAAPGDLLSSSVNDHLTNCVACKTLSRDQAKLQRIVSSLGTIEAPGDFDFRLRARLAGEKPGSVRPFSMFHLSFGLRSAAVATMLLLVASAFVFVSLRSHSNSPLAADASKTGPIEKGTGSGQPTDVVKTSAPESTANPNGNQPGVTVAGVKSPNSSDHSPGKRRNGPRQTELASLRDKNVPGIRDSSSTQAPVLKRYDQVVETYPTSAFPIDAAYQSLKVSVDNGRGTSRTISLPSVSFGSKQSLSQNGPPLVASARVAW